MRAVNVSGREEYSVVINQTQAGAEKSVGYHGDMAYGRVTIGPLNKQSEQTTTYK